LERGDVTATAFVVDHGEHLEPAYGYRVDYQGRSVMISGDGGPCIRTSCCSPTTPRSVRQPCEMSCRERGQLTMALWRAARI
jgi:hypothetical protein